MHSAYIIYGAGECTESGRWLQNHVCISWTFMATEAK